MAKRSAQVGHRSSLRSNNDVSDADRVDSGLKIFAQTAHEFSKVSWILPQVTFAEA